MPHRPWQQERRSAIRRQADTRVSQRHLGRLCGNGQVRGEHEAHASAGCSTVHGSDERCIHTRQRAQARMQVRGEFTQVVLHVVAAGHHAAQVTAEAEGLARARQNDGANGGVGSHLHRRRMKIAAECLVHGVGDIGAVQRQSGDGIRHREGHGAHCENSRGLLAKQLVELLLEVGH